MRDPGSDVLRVSGQIVDLAVDAAPARGSDMSSRDSAARMTPIVDVWDSQSAEPLARVADRRGIRPASGKPSPSFCGNPIRDWTDVERRFGSWAGFLREGLDELVGLPEVPLPE